jgi:transcriptional regulator CtsR
MLKVLISLPDQLAARMKTTIPERQRSKIISQLLEAEIIRREQALYECALAVENDHELNADLRAWDITSSDGLVDVKPLKQKGSK